MTDTPGPERIDRYARALYTADHPRGTWERRPPEDHEAYRSRARAAIREADTEMEQLHADRTEAITALDRARAAACRILTCAARWSRRAETAEAAITRGLHLADLIEAGAPWLASHEETAFRIRAALDTPTPQGGHVYLSTGCLHGDQVLPDGRTGHAYCQGDTGHAGSKTPACCKFCAAPCVCPCHREAS